MRVIQALGVIFILTSQSAHALELRSPAFEHNGAIPPKHTCDGADTSPPLEWSGVPEGARSLALTIDDPDAPDPAAPKMRWVHWVVYNIPPDAQGLPGGAGAGMLPQGSVEGLNSWMRAGYGGPCPPVGRHRYIFKIYALDTVLGDLNQPERDDLLDAMEGHIIEEAGLVGTYKKR